MQWVCYAYCWMTNYYHLVVEPQADNLSKGMRQVHGVHTRRCNRCHGRVSHILQGRYKAILVERDADLLALVWRGIVHPSIFGADSRKASGMIDTS